jgi:hypothetical protein
MLERANTTLFPRNNARRNIQKRNPPLAVRPIGLLTGRWLTLL